MNFIEEFRPFRGYIDNVPPDGGPLDNYMAAGSKNLVVLGPSLIESFKGFSETSPTAIARGTLNWAFGDTVLSLGEHPVSDAGSGNALLSVGKTVFLIGAGKLRVDGTTITGVTASSTLQLVLFDSGYSSTDLYQAGLAAPSAPTLAASGAGAKNTGTFTLVYTKVRTSTGAESKPSPPSNVATATQQELTGTFPLFSSWTDGTDAYNLYFTPANFGVRGPWLFLEQITASDLDGSGNYTTEFTDAELSPDEPPIDFGVPPAGTHVWQMGNVMIVGGTFGGFGISSSVPNFFEAYSATSTYFLPEALVGTAGGPQDGFTLLICKGSTHAAVWTGAPDGPAIIARPLWKNIGFPTVNAVTIAGRDIYGITAQQGIVRTGPNGEPDFEFARRVSEITKTWDVDEVKTGYSSIENVVYFSDSEVMLRYHIDMDVWDAPIYFSDVFGFDFWLSITLESIFTKNNQAFFVFYDGTQYLDRQLNTTDGSSTWELHTPWLKGGVGANYKYIERLLLEYKASRTDSFGLNIYKNYSNTTSHSASVSPPSTSNTISKWLKAFVRNAKTYKIKLNGTPNTELTNEQTVRFYGMTITGSVDTIQQG